MLVGLVESASMLSGMGRRRKVVVAMGCGVMVSVSFPVGYRGIGLVRWVVWGEGNGGGVYRSRARRERSWRRGGRLGLRLGASS